MAVQFSVALCTYNGEKYLREQLDSILAQTVPPAEVVIRDDQSTDHTMEILTTYISEFHKTHPNILVRVLESDCNLGVAGNFMTCARACSYEYILFADQDDIWHLDRLEKFAQAIDQSPDSVAILSDGRIVDELGQSTGQTLWLSHFFSRNEQREVQNGQAEKVLARHVFVTGSALAIRRDWLATVPDPAPEFYHDEWLGWFAGNKLQLLPEATYDYRQHASQQTGVHTTLKAKWEHIKRTQAHSRQLLERDVIRFPALATALSEMNLKERSQLIEHKVKFVQWRLALPHHVATRFVKVCVRLLDRSYQRYSIAYRSTIKDIFVHFSKT
ncbi:MAG: glycosyltransferase [Eubacteriales bacterium]|nr:glycosyltransferase [Eubacteriales bacterium]